MSKSITEINLYELVPASIRDDEQVSAAIAAINGEIQAVSALCEVPAIYARIDELDSKTLDHLAWQFDSKVYRDYWPVALKRSVIKSVIQTKSKKGTLKAVKDVLAGLGSSAVVREWWQESPPGTPHTFSITVSLGNLGTEVDANFQDDIQAAINDAKPARALYDFNLALNVQGELGLYGGVRTINYRRLDLVDLEIEREASGELGLYGGSKPITYRRMTFVES